MNIREAAVRYLEHRPRTGKEMKEHLLGKGYDSDEIDKTVKELTELNYLNDAEYVVAYLNYGFSKGKGMKLIRYELYDKGVSDNDIEEGIAAFEEGFGYDMEEEERERARRQALKVIDEGTVIDDRIAAKLARRLNSKGYESRLIWSVIDEIRRENEPV